MLHSALFARRAAPVVATLALVTCCVATVGVRVDAAQRRTPRPLAAHAAQYAQVYAFPANPTQGGVTPDAGLIALGGTLYGTTFNGGLLTNTGCEEGCGTVYSIGKNGAEGVLLSFGATAGSGVNPY